MVEQTPANAPVKDFTVAVLTAGGPGLVANLIPMSFAQELGHQHVGTVSSKNFVVQNPKYVPPEGPVSHYEVLMGGSPMSLLKL